MEDTGRPRIVQRAWWADPLIGGMPRPFDNVAIGVSRQRALLVASQLVAVLIAIYCGWHGYQIVDDHRLALGRALCWYALALLFMGYFAWDGSVPRVAAWPPAVVSYVRAHPVELAAVAGIVGIAAFVRLVEYGSLPPTGYLYLEEHINGGVAWNVLHGDRPYAYPLVRYSTALGLKLFGPSTLGLRSLPIATGIVVVIPFYLLMREMVHRPAALFATAIYASLRSLADVSAQFEVPTLAVVIMAWAIVRGVRTRNAVWFVPAAALAALVSYEYESFKAVPIFAAGFLAFAALRALLLPLPRSRQAWRDRIAGLAPHAVKVLVVIAIVVPIGFGPMIAQKHRGEDIYFASLDRQKADRSERGSPGLFAPNASDQMKWALQVFTPWVKPGYRIAGPVETRGVIDKITSLLLWAGVIAAALTFWRGSRAFFLAWFGGGLIISGLLLSNFAPWKVNGFTPAAVVLIGLLADDVWLLAKQVGARFDARLLGAVPVVFAALVAGVLVANVRTLHANAQDQRLLREYSGAPSQLYSICDYLRGRPADNFAVVSQRARFGWGFSHPPVDDNERIGAWNDHKFVCWGLLGQSVPDLNEAWPYYIDGDRPVSLVMVGRADEIGQAVDSTRRAMPEFGDPALVKSSPGGVFQTLVFNATSAELNARSGLVLRTLAADERVVPSPDFEVSVPVGTPYALSGIVYLPEGADVVFGPNATASRQPLRISVDGAVSYDSTGLAPVETPAPLLQGWHLIEVRGVGAGAQSLNFTWQRTDGSVSIPDADSYFALTDTGVWRHERTYVRSDGTSFDTVRFDYHPHLAAFDGLRVDARQPLPDGTRVLSERWSSRWSVPADLTYRFVVDAPSGAATVTIDGKDILADRLGFDITVDVPLTGGDHTVEIVTAKPADPFTGVLLHVFDPGAGRKVDIPVHPF